MTVLLILAIVWVVGLGYYLMGRIDNFLNARTSAENIHEDCRMVLFFASDEDNASLKMSLIDKNIPILSTDEPDIPENVRIITVLAISNNDLDNLLLCNKAKHHFPDVYLIAKCNDPLYQDVFRGTGVHQIINSNYSWDSIIDIIMNSSVQGLNPVSTPDDRRTTK